jgi:hypothetical protein
MQSVESQPTFCRNMSTPSSGSKNKTNNEILLTTWFHAGFSSAYSSTLKMEATYYSETSVDFQRTAQRYITQDRTLIIHSVRQEFACLLWNAKFISVLKKARHWTLSLLTRTQGRPHSPVLPNAFTKYCQHIYDYIFHVVSFHKVYKLKLLYAFLISIRATCIANPTRLYCSLSCISCRMLRNVRAMPSQEGQSV